MKNVNFPMKTIIRLTESDLHKFIREAVKIALMNEGAYDKYQKDLADIDLDSVQDDMGMAYAYSQMNDPMIKNVKGSTVRSMLSPEMGNKIDDTEGDYEDYSQDFIEKEWLNTPNDRNKFKSFPRQSKTNGGLKDYDSLRNGSERINAYKQRKRV